MRCGPKTFSGLMPGAGIQRHRGRTGNPPYADELLQETFTEALAALERFEPGTNPNAWLRRIMLNTFISGYRKRRAKPRLVTADATDSQLFFGRSHAISAEDQVFSRLDANLTAALRALPDRQRVVVHLADLEGLGYGQISVLTGIPLGRVKSSLARCRLRAGLRSHTSRGNASVPGPRACSAGGGPAARPTGSALTSSPSTPTPPVTLDRTSLMWRGSGRHAWAFGW